MAKEKSDGFIEERLGIKKYLDAFLYRKVPRGVGWYYTLGSATLMAFILLLVTGVFLMMNYSPSPDHAYDSIQHIMNDIPFGSLIRSIHYWSASAMVVLVGLHAVRTFFMGAYKYPRELTWITGVILLIAVMGAGFTGYLLPWDQRAYWATNVAAGIAGEVPVIGPWVRSILIGGNSIGAVTLTRFFTLHVAVIAPIIILFVSAHISMVVKGGISAPPRK